MTNSRYDIPRELKRKCENGSETLRTFYQSCFVHDIIAFRGEYDFRELASLSAEELEVAKALIVRNLEHRHCAEAAKRVSAFVQSDE